MSLKCDVGISSSGVQLPVPPSFTHTHFEKLCFLLWPNACVHNGLLPKGSFTTRHSTAHQRLCVLKLQYSCRTWYVSMENYNFSYNQKKKGKGHFHETERTSLGKRCIKHLYSPVLYTTLSYNCWEGKQPHPPPNYFFLFVFSHLYPCLQELHSCLQFLADFG